MQLQCSAKYKHNAKHIMPTNFAIQSQIGDLTLSIWKMASIWNRFSSCFKKLSLLTGNVAGFEARDCLVIGPPGVAVIQDGVDWEQLPAVVGRSWVVPDVEHCIPVTLLLLLMMMMLMMMKWHGVLQRWNQLWRNSCSTIYEVLHSCWSLPKWQSKWQPWINRIHWIYSQYCGYFSRTRKITKFCTVVREKTTNPLMYGQSGMKHIRKKQTPTNSDSQRTTLYLWVLRFQDILATVTVQWFCRHGRLLISTDSGVYPARLLLSLTLTSRHRNANYWPRSTTRWCFMTWAGRKHIQTMSLLRSLILSPIVWAMLSDINITNLVTDLMQK